MVRVIDASVAIKWFVLEEAHERALALLEEILRAPKSFAVPELFYFELAHVFHRALPEPSHAQVSLLERVITFGIQRFALTQPLLAEIRTLQRRQLSGYDAAYVALAKLLDGKWITCDSNAHACVAELGLSELL